MKPPPDHDSDTPFLPTLGQGLALWLLYVVAHNIGGMFAEAIERSWPGSWWTIALAAVLLAAPPLAVVWLGKRLTGHPWTALLVVFLAAQLATAPFLKAMLIAPLTEKSMFRGPLLAGFLHPVSWPSPATSPCRSSGTPSRTGSPWRSPPSRSWRPISLPVP